jgi:hypothetical protein
MDRDAILAQVRMITLVEDTNVSDAEIVILINNALQEISLASEWPWLEESATMSLVDSTATIALPADFNYGIAVIDNDNEVPLQYVEPKEFFNRYSGDLNESDTPTHFTIYENLVHVWPIPSANDTARLTIYYYETVTTLSAGGSTPQFHAAFHPMVVEYCKWKLYDREEYFDQSERAFITFSRYLQNMIEFYGKRFKTWPFIAGDGTYTNRVVDPNLRWVYQV